ncbi:hypothetical protein [Bradyrhizobium sp.]|uniref:hypothetical protein n=1 Tax=Bradyrhizobium sp. TaxID=376 RepID=UPI001ED5BC42|nr:hypothetical protein [Bradyrhizobium sp.]MBV8917464.1 hypothetical protein [Bradyrhizobium sp.]MBV9979593.1 hypothetical protein [Bradyrhizobium sp.]
MDQPVGRWNPALMASTTYALFRNAILASNRSPASMMAARALCPHIIDGNKAGEEVVLAWQFAGDSSGPLPRPPLKGFWQNREAG